MKRELKRRVGFWRSLIEITLAGLIFTLLGYTLLPAIGSPWQEIFSYLSISIYFYAAWRLSPGRGNLVFCAFRVLAWGILLSAILFAMVYFCLYYVIHQGTFLGIDMNNLRPTVGTLLVSSVLVGMAPFILTRTLIALWEAGRTQLRWRLTYSFLLITVLALLSITPVQSIYVSLVSLTVAPTLLDPQEAAQRATSALAPLTSQGASQATLSTALKGLFNGTTHVPLPHGNDTLDGPQPPAFTGVRRFTIISPEGQVIASAGDSPYAVGAPIAPTRRANFDPLIAQARSSNSCVLARPANGPVADSGACTLPGPNGAPGPLLLMETNVDSSAQFQADFLRIFTFVFVETSGAIYLLFMDVLGILVIAGGGGYLLSRRMTRRIERLANATADVSAGNFSRRVQIDSADEIARLGIDFNAMAERLQEREAALTAEKERAERLLQANKRLVADVSHELRTPLTTLRGYVEALEQDYGDQLPTRDLNVIHGEIERLTTLIEDLFTLARAEAHQLPLNIQEVDTEKLVTRITGTLAPLARRERQIEMVTDLPPDLPRVSADPVRLEQVMLNLLQNALRYTLPGGIIAVQGSAADGVVTLSVDDTGVGIPPEELSMVFDRFYRSDRSRARESGGAGLGLALVHELVGAMGGHVDVQSTPGKGSRFTVALHQAT